MSETVGTCLCGTVRYRIAAPYRWFAYCHCSMCRKQHGALFSAGVGVGRERFEWLAGEADIVHYQATAAFERPFCRHCGAKVPGRSHVDGVLNVPAGALDDQFDARPDKHIFAASRSSSEQIADRLPQFDRYPPSTHLQAADTARSAPPAGMLGGSCLCAAVTYEIDGTLKGAVNCHCSRCRRSRGSAFGTSALAPAERFRFTRGERLLRSYRLPGAERYGVCFCGECGSLMPVIVPSFGTIVPIATLDGDAALPVIAHLFVGSKAPWHEITDTLPQHAAAPPPELVRALVA